MIKKEKLLDYNLDLFQDDDTFLFNLDSILLAEYVKTKKNVKILDMCSGNAIISLILLTKENDIMIDCVEIQSNVCKIAKKNIEINNFSDKVSIININLNKLKKGNYYDIIVCNPPYFKKNNNKSNNISKSIATHEIQTNIEEIIKYSKKYLKPEGKIFLSFKPERMPELIYLLKHYSFGILNITYIITKEKKVYLLLIEAQKSRKDNTKIEFVNVKNKISCKNIFKE